MAVNFLSGMSNLAQIQGREEKEGGKARISLIRIALTSPAGKIDVCMSFLVFSHTSHRAMCRTRPRVMRRRESIGALSKPLHNQSPDEEDTRCNDTRPIGADSSRSFVISTVSTSTWSVNIHEGGGSQNQHELEKKYGWAQAARNQGSDHALRGRVQRGGNRDARRGCRWI